MTWNAFNPKAQKTFRQKLRSDMPQPERVLWGYLRNEQLGVKFRRQFGIGPYVTDFYSHEISLAIECDGDSHFTDSQVPKDKKRNAYFESLGITTLRFMNVDIMESIDGVMEKIMGEVEARRRGSDTLSNSP